MTYLKSLTLLFITFVTFSCSTNNAGSDTDTEMPVDTDDGCSAGGNWYDPVTDLCWQHPPSESQMNWYEAVGESDPNYNPGGVIDYCGDGTFGGKNDWRMPDIDELISIIRGCVDGQSTSDLSISNCCVDDPECPDDGYSKIKCNGCSYLNGPGFGGCYLDPALSGGCLGYWSSTINPFFHPMCIMFNYARVTVCPYDHGNRHVRCVRSAQ